MPVAGVLALDWNHLSARRVDAPASPLNDPLDTPAAQAMGACPAFPDTNFEAMIVSEGVREMPAAHPPEFRRRALAWLPRETLSARPRVNSGSASPVFGTG